MNIPNNYVDINNFDDNFDIKYQPQQKIFTLKQIQLSFLLMIPAWKPRSRRGGYRVDPFQAGSPRGFNPLQGLQGSRRDRNDVSILYFSQCAENSHLAIKMH